MRRWALSNWVRRRKPKGFIFDRHEYLPELRLETIAQWMAVRQQIFRPDRVLLHVLRRRRSTARQATHVISRLSRGHRRVFQPDYSLQALQPGQGNKTSFGMGPGAADDKIPAFQFYPADWRKDPGVQSLSYNDRGIWIEIFVFNARISFARWISYRTRFR